MYFLLYSGHLLQKQVHFLNLIKKINRKAKTAAFFSSILSLTVNVVSV